MDATGKAKWIEEAAKDKERFNREKAAFLAKQNGPSGLAQAERSNVKQASLANVDEAPKQVKGNGGNKQLKGDEMNKGGAIRGDVQSSSGSTSCPSGNVFPSIAKYFAFLFTQWSGVRQVGNCLAMIGILLF